MCITPETIDKIPPQYLIPDSAPTVAIGLDYGRSLTPGTVLDINYYNLNYTLDKLGAPQNRANLSIVLGVTPQKNNLQTNGDFDARLNRITTYHRASYSHKKEQNTLVHELQHYSDHQHYRLDSQGKQTVTVLGNIGLLFRMPSLTAYATSVVFEVTNQLYGAKYGHTFLDQDFMHDLSTYNGVVAFTVYSLSGFYWFNPWERRARKASRPPFRFESGHSMLDNKHHEESTKVRRCRAL